MNNAVHAVVGTLIVVVSLMLGTAVVDSLTASQDGVRMQESSAVLLGDTGKYTKIADATGFDETVYNSRGHAVNLSGTSDSYVQSKSGYEIASDDTWTVSLWARVDSEASTDTMTALSANGRVVVNYNGTDGNWTAWYYDESSRDSWVVNVSAPDQPANLTNVMVWSNGTHLTIYRNNTQGDLIKITGDSIEDAPVESTNWNGRLDEVRTFDDALNNTQRSEVVDSPIKPQKGTNRTSRIMFDQPDKDVQLIFFTDTKLEQSNVTFSDGLDGEKMNPKDALLGAADYEWETNGPQIKPLAGEQLDGAPVAYVDYQYEGALHSLIAAWSDFTQIAAMIPLFLVIGGILIVLRAA